MLTKDNAKHTIADLRAAPVVPPPDVSDKWRGVNHGELIDALTAACRERGWRVGELAAHLSRGGAWLTASFPVRGAVPFHLPGRAVPHVGVCVANDTRHHLTFYVGGRDDAAGFVYDAFRASRNYAVGFNLGDEVQTALGRWESQARRMGRVIEAAAGRPCGPRSVERLLLESGRGHQDRRLIPPSRVFRVDELVRQTPEPTQWDVIRAFGRVADTCSPEIRLDQLLGIWRLVTAPASEREPAAV